MSMTPLASIERRAPEAGRIRTGIKSGRAMKSIDTFRFTSPHKEAIEELARIYGGEAKPWNEPTANKNQYEVITKASSIEVFLQPGGLTTHYEMWSGGGCQRRCDGEMCEVPTKGPEATMKDVPCICNLKGVAECKPYTRLNVVLPNINFYGVWRLESKGWNAAKELPGMHDMVAQLSVSGRMVRAFLNLEQRTSKRGGTTKHFIVPTISMATTPDELLAGEGTTRPSLKAAPAHELNAGPASPPSSYQKEDDESDEVDPDDDVIDAEVVETVEEEPQRTLRSIAVDAGLDGNAFILAVWGETDGDLTKIKRMIRRVEEGKLAPVSVDKTGVIWSTGEPT